MMRTLNAAALAFLALLAATPALAQQSQEFRGSICEIDTSAFKLTTPYLVDGSQSVYTFNSVKLCTGVASKRNIKLECTAPLPGWNRGDRQVKNNFTCTINGDQCGVLPKPADANAPYLTATERLLKVRGGIATLTCFYKP
jgi:hypothetical protein